MLTRPCHIGGLQWDWLGTRTRSSATSVRFVIHLWITIVVWVAFGPPQPPWANLSATYKPFVIRWWITISVKVAFGGLIPRF